MSNPKFQVGQKVRVLDGSKITRYTGGWAYSMHKYVGEVFRIREVVKEYDGRIGYRINDGGGFKYDERGLEIVKEDKIVIRVDPDDPMRVIAKNILTGKTGIAKCSPEDEFNFDTGAALALSRLIGKTEVKTKDTGRKFEVGDVVIGNDYADKRYIITRKNWVGVVEKVQSASHRIKVKSLKDGRWFEVEEGAFDLLSREGYTGKLVCIKQTGHRWWTVGKTYAAACDVIYDDDNHLRRDIKPMAGRGSKFYKIDGAEFVALEGDAK